jgi:N-carbamoylputrescine amidase
VVIAPSGEMIKKRLDDKEGLMVADLNATLLSRVRRHRMRYFLPQRRNDLFGL